MYEKRLGRLLILFVAILGVIGVQAFRIQVLRAGQHVQKLESRIRRRIVLMPRRGEIVARDGTPLAGNEPGFAAHLDLSRFDATLCTCTRCGHAEAIPHEPGKRPRSCHACGGERGFDPVLGEPGARPDPGTLSPPDSEGWECRECRAVTNVPAHATPIPAACPACREPGSLAAQPRPEAADLARLLEMDEAAVLRAVARVRRKHRLRTAQGRQRFALYPMLPRIPREAGKTISAHPDRYQGIEVLPVPGRVVEPAAASVVGHVQLPSGKHVERLMSEEREELGKHRYLFSEAIQTLMGVKGLEGKFDEYLRGVPGRGQRIRKDRRTFEEGMEILSEVRDGGVLHTTLDLDLQRLAHEIVTGAPSDAAAVVLDLRDGAVLAIASKSRDGYHHAVTRVRPGSVFKLVTALAFLESGGDPDEELYCTNSGYLRPRLRFRCRNHPAGDVDLATAFSKSCNYYFMHRAEDAGNDHLVDALTRLGLDRNERLGLKGSLAGLEYFPGIGKHFLWHDLAYTGYGQGRASASPLQIAVAYGRLATGGRLITPYLVIPPGGDRPPAPGVDPVIARHAHLLRKAARRVVVDGTGRKQESLALVRAAGKSGTAEVERQPGDPGDHHLVNHAWFAGYAPFDAPRFVAVVVKERVLEHGAEASGGDVGRLLQEALGGE